MPQKGESWGETAPRSDQSNQRRSLIGSPGPIRSDTKYFLPRKPLSHIKGFFLHIASSSSLKSHRVWSFSIYRVCSFSIYRRTNPISQCLDVVTLIIPLCRHGRQTDRQTDKHTHRQTNRQTDRHTDKNTHTHTHTHTYTYTQISTKTEEKQADMRKKTHTHKQTHIYKHTRKDTHAHTHTDTRTLKILRAYTVITQSCMENSENPAQIGLFLPIFVHCMTLLTQIPLYMPQKGESWGETAPRSDQSNQRRSLIGSPGPIRSDTKYFLPRKPLSHIKGFFLHIASSSSLKSHRVWSFSIYRVCSFSIYRRTNPISQCLDVVTLIIPLCRHGRQTDRQTDKHTHRQTNRQTDRHTDKNTHTHTHTHTYTYTQISTKTEEKQADMRKKTHTHKQTHIYKHTRKDTHAHTHTDTRTLKILRAYTVITQSCMENSENPAQIGLVLPIFVHFRFLDSGRESTSGWFCRLDQFFFQLV